MFDYHTYKTYALFIGAHPDDIELGAGGTVAKLTSEGKTVSFIDLTQGEMGTHGTPFTRRKEAQKAAEILQVDRRVNLKMRDGFFENEEKNQRLLASWIRYFRPKFVFTNPLKDRHPDHGRSANLTVQACFLAGLKTLELELENTKLNPWRPINIFHYMGSRFQKPDLLLDITGFTNQKKEAILAYRTQFVKTNLDSTSTPINDPFFIDNVLFRDKELAQESLVESVEGFVSNRQNVVVSLENIR